MHVFLTLWLAVAVPPLRSWPALLDAANRDPALQPACRALIAAARKTAQNPPIRRAYRLEDLGKNRTFLDGRSRALEPEIRETFALAMSDMGACQIAAEELPLIAAAFRLSGDQALLHRVLEQLTEMASWSPIQRPGWTLYAPGHRLPPDGKDGNWLATGLGVRAIADSLEILPAGSVPDELRARLDDLLRREIYSIVDDWHTRRSWFISSHNSRTNQWALPTEGLVRACLVLGRDRFQSEYELGVRNLLDSLASDGPAGEFDEGIQYAVFTVTSLLSTARAMAVAGDPRAIEQPFLQNFPTWMMHHLQPGRYLINCFDAFDPSAPRGGDESIEASSHTAVASSLPFRKLLSLIAVSTGSAVARWALAQQFNGPLDDVAGVAVRALPPGAPAAPPPPFGVYPRAPRVNWRDSWEDNGTGVWVRGGSKLDQHDHQDRGHVNFILRGRPILIEAGTPSYDTPDMMSLYASGAGHNVLQIGTVPPPRPGQFKLDEDVRVPGWQKAGCVAPMAVRRLDASQGDIQVEGTACYDGLQAWIRDVSWNAAELHVHDKVTLLKGGEEVIQFRWHLGTNDPVRIEGKGSHFTISWPGAKLTLLASTPLTVLQETMPDHTLKPSPWVKFHPNFHTCLVVRSARKVNLLEINTSASQ